MNIYHLFKNWEYQRTIQTKSNMLQVLADFQRAEKTVQQQTFTVLNPRDGFAFSQTYKIESENKVSWGNAFKHEAGLLNPEPIPSFDKLLALVPLDGKTKNS